ncbi:MAG: DUF5103 domain-containing protein [Prevotellaceae bacterium]|jgi:hypothetical protein|nr:DUF5103 domain-containing protein [Prevotellaceae bacterium]
MNKNIFRWLLLLTVAAPCPAAGQLRKGADGCFDKSIKTIQLRKLGSEMTDPVIALHSSEKLLLSFDDLSGSGRFLAYKIVLCDADWREADLFPSDYIEGFASDNISGYEQSFNTLVGYTHYALEVPNAQMQVKLSGSYLIKVYDGDNMDEPLLQRSFSVVEDAGIGAQVKVRTLPLAGNDECSQQLELLVEHPRQPIDQPYSELKVRVEQNGFRFLQLPSPAPIFIRSKAIDYTQPGQNLYPGGSEYRYFDISTTEYKTARVREVTVANDQYNVLLEPDERYRQYLYSQDLNGRYVIRNERYRDESDTQSDYLNVLLSLKMAQPLPGTVYVFGELSGWELSSELAMLYSERRRAYELSVPLKQGYYSYKYVYVDETGALDMGALDACSSETENIYGVYIYYRSPTDRHDRLVSATWVSTQKELAAKNSPQR